MFNNVKKFDFVNSFFFKSTFPWSYKAADSLSWPKDSWVLLLQSVLVGKAQEIYGSLSVEQSSNYEHVKGNNPQSLRASP